MTRIPTSAHAQHDQQEDISAARPRALSPQAQEAASTDRARLARELHDSVTHALFALTLHADAAQTALEREVAAGAIPGDGPVVRNVRYVSELAAGALAEMHALIFELRPGALQEEGLAMALRKHAAALSAREGLPITVQVPEHGVALVPAMEEHLYRVAQEALHNVIKHAGRCQAHVRLEADADELVLEIADDGKGFDPAAIPAGHLGVRTMAERVDQVGGILQIQSAPRAGTTVRVTVWGVQTRPGSVGKTLVPH